VKCDHAAGSYERCPLVEVAAHALVLVIGVDKKEIDGGFPRPDYIERVSANWLGDRGQSTLTHVIGKGFRHASVHLLEQFGVVEPLILRTLIDAERIDAI
jgi:hypothetical protein